MAVGLLAVSLTGRAAFPRRLVQEPVFGLAFAPDKAHFDRLALADLPQACRPALLGRYVPEARFLVYADQAVSSARVLLLGVKDGGVVLVIRTGACAVADVLPTLRQHSPPQPAASDPPVLTPSETRLLFGDVLTRYARAFSGKQLFLAWLDTLTAAMRAGCEAGSATECPTTWHSLPVDLQAMLERFRHG